MMTKPLALSEEFHEDIDEIVFTILDKPIVDEGAFIEVLLSQINSLVHNLSQNADHPVGGRLNHGLLRNRATQIAAVCGLLYESFSGAPESLSTGSGEVLSGRLLAEIRRLYDGAECPQQANATDVGYDLRASSRTIVKTGELAYIPTGVIVKPPEGYHFEIKLRSSAPKKYGFLMPHGVGIIDPSYCGPGDELFVQVYKFGPGTKDRDDDVCVLEAGERVAQLTLLKTHHFEWSDSTGSIGGFGSTRGGFGSTGSK